MAYQPDEPSGRSVLARVAGVAGLMVAGAFALEGAAVLHRAAVLDRRAMTRLEYDDALNLTHWAWWAIPVTLIVTTVAVMRWQRSTAERLLIPNPGQVHREQTSVFGSPASRVEWHRRLNRELDGLDGVRAWRTRTTVLDLLLAAIVVIGQWLLLRHASTRADLATACRSTAGLCALASATAAALACCRWQFMTRADAEVGQLTRSRR